MLIRVSRSAPQGVCSRRVRVGGTRQEVIAVLRRPACLRSRQNHCCEQQKQRESPDRFSMHHALSGSILKSAIIPKTARHPANNTVTASNTGISRFIMANHASWPSPGRSKITSTGMSKPIAMRKERSSKASD